MVDHRTARAVGKHTEAFGDDAHDVSVDLLDDDVGYVMPERVRVAQRASRLNDCVDSAQLAAAVVPKIVNDVGREQLAEPIERALVHEMAVKGDQLVDREPLVSGQLQ